jgi:hypothetical protein
VLFRALGAEVVEQKARQGDMEAQFSQGCRLLVSDGAGSSDAAGTSPKVEVGLARACTFRN